MGWDKIVPKKLIIDISLASMESIKGEEISSAEAKTFETWRMDPVWSGGGKVRAVMSDAWHALRIGELIVVSGV